MNASPKVQACTSISVDLWIVCAGCYGQRMSDPRPIGLFDSGIGGLTVLREVQARLPAESTIYIGDSARHPYGTRSGAEVRTFAEELSDELVARGVKVIIIACNTATAVALDTDILRNTENRHNAWSFGQRL